MSSKKTKRSNYQIGYCTPIEYELVCTSPPDGYESPDYTEEIVEDLDDAEKNIYHKGIPMTVLKEMKIVRYLESDFTTERAVPDFSGFNNRVAEAKKWWGMEKRWFFEKTWFEIKGGNRTIYEDMVKVFFLDDLHVLTAFFFLSHATFRKESEQVAWWQQTKEKHLSKSVRDTIAFNCTWPETYTDTSL